MLTLRAALLWALLACAAAAPARQQRRVRGGKGVIPEMCGVEKMSKLVETSPSLDAFVEQQKGQLTSIGQGGGGKVYLVKKTNGDKAVIKIATELSNIKDAALKKEEAFSSAQMELLAGLATCAPDVAPCAPGTPVMRYEG